MDLQKKYLVVDIEDLSKHMVLVAKLSVGELFCWNFVSP